jgi:hypothetical protein
MAVARRGSRRLFRARVRSLYANDHVAVGSEWNNVTLLGFVVWRAQFLHPKRERTGPRGRAIPRSRGAFLGLSAVHPPPLSAADPAELIIARAT